VAARLICSKIFFVTPLLLPYSVEEISAWSRNGERKEWRRLLGEMDESLDLLVHPELRFFFFFFNY
jgi:hypothetical protein